MVSCAVDGCNSSGACNCIKYFSLPKIEPESSLWLKLLNKENCTEREQRLLSICSNHFIESDVLQDQGDKWTLKEGACPVLVEKANFKDCSCYRTDSQIITKAARNTSITKNVIVNFNNVRTETRQNTPTIKNFSTRYIPILPNTKLVSDTTQTDPTYLIVLPSDAENSPTSNTTQDLSINKMGSPKDENDTNDISTNKRVSLEDEKDVSMSDTDNDPDYAGETDDDEDDEDFTIVSKKRKKIYFDKKYYAPKNRKRNNFVFANHTNIGTNSKKGRKKFQLSHGPISKRKRSEVTFEVDILDITGDKKSKSTVKSVSEINKDTSTESIDDPRDNFKITLPYSSKNKNSSNANSAENLTSKPTSDMLSSLQLKPVSSNDGNNVNGKPAISTTNKDTESHNKAPSLVSQNKLGCLGSIVPGTQPISIATPLNKEVPQQGMYILPNFSNATVQNTPTFIIPPMNNAIQPSGLQNGPVTLILPPQGPQVASNLPVVGSSLPVTENTTNKDTSIDDPVVNSMRSRVKHLEYVASVSTEKIRRLTATVNEHKDTSVNSSISLLKKRIHDLEYVLSKTAEKIDKLNVKSTWQQRELRITRKKCERLKNNPLPDNTKTIKKMNLQPPLDDIIKKLVTGKEGHSLPIKQFSVALNFMSPDAYSFIRELFNNVLPHPSSLYEWNSNNKNTANNSMQGQNDLYEVEAFQSDSDSDNLDSMPTTSKNSEVTSTQVSSNDTLGQCLEYVGIHDL